jgi:hypothetical protein
MNLLLEARLATFRPGADPRVLDLLFAEPLHFACYFATIAPHLDDDAWPADLSELLTRVRERYRPHDTVLKLMDTLRGQLPMALSTDLARHLAEGLELHAVLVTRRAVWIQICTALYRRFDPDTLPDPDSELGAAGRLQLLTQALDLSPAEARFIALVVIISLSTALQLLLRVFSDQRRARNILWESFLGVDAAGLATVLAPGGRLTGAGLVQMRDGIPRLTDYWCEQVVRTDTDLLPSLVQPLAPKAGSGGVARLPAEDRSILTTLLARRDAGINLLLYGKPAVDKARLAQELIEEAGASAYTLVPDLPEGDRAAVILVAQGLLSRTDGAVVLVVEQAAAILGSARSVLALFGLTDDDDEAPSLDERLLSDNPVPTLWLAQDPGRLHRETLTRFLFHAEALKGTRADREALVDSFIATLPIAERDKAELARLEGLSVPQLEGARRLAKMTSGSSRRTFARHFRIAAERSQRALARREKDAARMSVTRYSLDYLHAAGRFGPAQILKAFRQRPQGSLCLYGLPGTGKTQYAEHLAHEIGKPLLIKLASQLFDKYVGESEKRIGEAFDQAEEEGAVLLLDEADSFLRERSLSSHTWELTTVNELLQRMERFEEILICTTNLYQQVDRAALRRFTFKLEFLPLRMEQRWAMFENESGLTGRRLGAQQRSEWEERLALMKDLTAGDFATVKRQCLLLGEELSPSEWLEQLEVEVKAKVRTETPEEGGRMRVS